MADRSRENLPLHDATVANFLIVATGLGFATRASS